jgi:hypothetical protein
MEELIEVGQPVFLSDGEEEFGAVRAVGPDGMVIYVENAGEFLVPFDAIDKLHYGKVVVACDRLDRELRDAIGHAHDAEVPGL